MSLDKCHFNSYDFIVNYLCRKDIFHVRNGTCFVNFDLFARRIGSERRSFMYKVAICDDNPADLQLITDYLTEPEFHYPLELFSFHDGVELAHAYQKEGQFDLIILDMMMDRLNGIETALKIRKVDQNVAILIVTATVEYAIEGYKINAARYIVKPVSKREFQKITRNIFAFIDKKRGAYYRFPSKSGTTVISMEDIFYFESDIRSIHISSRQGDYTFTGRISAVEEQTEGHGFLRVHKSFIVNLKHVHNIFKDSVTLDNGEVIPLSRHRHREVNQKFLDYMEEQII